MELLDEENMDDMEVFTDVQCIVCDDVMLESDFIEHVIEEHPDRLVGLIKETLIIEKLTKPLELIYC